MRRRFCFARRLGFGPNVVERLLERDVPVDVVAPVAHRSANALAFQKAAQAHFQRAAPCIIGLEQILAINAAIAKKRDRLRGATLVVFLFCHEGGDFASKFQIRHPC